MMASLRRAAKMLVWLSILGLSFSSVIKWFSFFLRGSANH